MRSFRSSDSLFMADCCLQIRSSALSHFSNSSSFHLSFFSFFPLAMRFLFFLTFININEFLYSIDFSVLTGLSNVRSQQHGSEGTFQGVIEEQSEWATKLLNRRWKKATRCDRCEVPIGWLLSLLQKLQDGLKGPSTEQVWPLEEEGDSDCTG